MPKIAVSRREDTKMTELTKTPTSTINHEHDNTRLALEGSIVYFMLFGAYYGIVSCWHCARLSGISGTELVACSTRAKLTIGLVELVLATIYIGLEAHARRFLIIDTDKEAMECSLNSDAALFDRCKKISKYYLAMHIVFVMLSTSMILIMLIGINTTANYALIDLLYIVQFVVSIAVAIYTVKLKKKMRYK